MRNLTEDERSIVEALGAVANRAARLPEIHGSDIPEFVQGTHVLQNIVLARPAVEAMQAEQKPED